MHTVPMFVITIQWSQQVSSYCQQTYCWWNRWKYLVYTALDLTQPSWMPVKFLGSLLVHVQTKNSTAIGKKKKKRHNGVALASVCCYWCSTSGKIKFNPVSQVLVKHNFLHLLHIFRLMYLTRDAYQSSRCHQISNVPGRLQINADSTISEVTAIKRKALELAALCHSWGQMSDFLRVVSCLQTKQECVTSSQDLTDTHCFQLHFLRVLIIPSVSYLRVTDPGVTDLISHLLTAQQPSKPAFTLTSNFGFYYLLPKLTQDCITVQ